MPLHKMPRFGGDLRCAIVFLWWRRVREGRHFYMACAIRFLVISERFLRELILMT